MVFSLFGISVAKADISYQDEPEKVVRVLTNENRIRFEFCRVQDTQEVCSQIGSRDYSREELVRLRRYLYGKGVLVTAAGVAVVLGAATIATGVGFGAGAVYGVIAQPGVDVAGLYFGGIGGMAGAGTGAAGGLVFAAKKLNPIENIRKGLALSDQVLSVQRVALSGEGIDEFSQRLVGALSTLDSQRGEI